MGYISTMEYYPTIKSNEVLIIYCHMNETWNLLSGRSQTEKATHIVWFHLYEVPRMGKSMETESRLVLARDWERGSGRWLANELGLSLESNDFFLELDSGDGCITRILKITELYTWKWFKWWILGYVNFIPISSLLNWKERVDGMSQCWRRNQLCQPLKKSNSSGHTPRACPWPCWDLHLTRLSSQDCALYEGGDRV